MIEQSEEKFKCLDTIKIFDLNFNEKIQTSQSSQQDDESFYEEMFNHVLSSFASVSDMLRSVKSNVVAIPALCDILWLYANTQTYFTPNEVYKKCKGDY